MLKVVRFLMVLLSAADVAAGQYHINTFRLSNTGVVGSQLHIIDNNQQLLWTPDNLIVGKISGNANGLEDVGLLTQDFESSLIKEGHLDGAVIASRNLLPGAIKASHLGLRNIQIDRLIPAIINADLLANDSISSDNIIPETLTFDILQENDVSDFVPDGFQSSIVQREVFTTDTFKIKIYSQTILLLLVLFLVILKPVLFWVLILLIIK